ncbi:hypothetical protein BKA62DRAFT_689094 [Auriculariales sp. MPI-PUGE-AT-0066]|nr:hypothetical protein BKA62DRAFT_689094 [Auriculariales sp. MPI-PUGE-AT-0066]
MLSVALVAVSLALTASAIVEPSEPAPGNDYPVGGICNIQWNADTTGTWQNTYVQLMTGSDDAMVHLTTVAHFDGTNTANTTFTYTCPDVTLYAPVYLYQFTSDASLANPNLIQWTGRFSISNGAVLPAPNGNWGTGALVNAAVAIGPPPTVAGGAAIPDPGSQTPAAPTDTTTTTESAASTPTDPAQPDPGSNETNTTPSTTSDPPVGVQTSAGADHALPGVGANTRTTKPGASAAAANSSATPAGAAISTRVSAASLLAAAGIAAAALL